MLLAQRATNGIVLRCLMRGIREGAVMCLLFADSGGLTSFVVARGAMDAPRARLVE